MSAPSSAEAVYRTLPIATVSATVAPNDPETKVGALSSTFVIASVTSCSAVLPAASVATTVNV